jgi:tetratricopeptide (TPR) repeat protein
VEAPVKTVIDPGAAPVAGWREKLAENKMTPAEAQAFGVWLYQSLFRGDISLLLNRALGETMGRDDLGLRLRLRLNPPELAALPWEFLYSPERRLFLAASVETPLSRYVNLPEPLRPMACPERLRMLVVIPQNSGLDTAAERDILEKIALKITEIDRPLESSTPPKSAQPQRPVNNDNEVKRRRKIAVDFLDGLATTAAIRAALREKEYHIFHYAGHGDFKNDEAFLYLDHETKLAEEISAGQFARFFTDYAFTRLVFLNACQAKKQRQAWEEKEKQLTEQAVENARLAGDSHYNDNRFEKALAAYQSARQLVDKTKSPQQWANLALVIGNANWALGIRTEGEKIQKYLSAAQQAYQQAGEVWPREREPEGWASVQASLGNVLGDLGTRTGGEEGAKLLSQAVAAFKNALLVWTYEYIPTYWATAQNNLAEVYEHLQDWPNVAACYANVLKVYPRYAQAYQTASYLYHEALFNFPEAFVLNQNWLAQFPEDLSAQCDFAEKHFTTARFAECETRLAALLANSEIEHSTKIALRAIQIANLLALGKAHAVPNALETLHAAIPSQPDTFTARNISSARMRNSRRIASGCCSFFKRWRSKKAGRRCSRCCGKCGRSLMAR